MSLLYDNKPNPWFIPFAFLYGLGVRLRNLLFDLGILRSISYNIPIINIGNLAVGGTGKTPHTEYLIRLLTTQYRIAILSRGYKRKTKGFLLADKHSTANDLGDEPYQMVRKFPQCTIAVDGNRRRGISKLLKLEKRQRPEIILLDDAYQHRYVKPSYNILLTTYDNPFYEDYLMPLGLLREPRTGASRANIVIVTKCGKKRKPIDYRITRRNLDLKPYQELFFTHVKYGKPQPLFPESSATNKEALTKEDEVLVVTGIAHPKPFVHYLSTHVKKIHSIIYPDHHNFTKEDIKKILQKFETITSQNRYLFFTEKDAMRLIDHPDIPQEYKSYMYYIPIQINFCNGKGGVFDKIIMEHIHSMQKTKILK